MSLRLNAANCRIVFNPDIRVQHKNPTTFEEIIAKSRQQLPFVVKMLRNLPPDLQDKDIPFPRSAFFGLATLRFNALTLAGTLFFLHILRAVVLTTTKFCLTLRCDNPVTFKLYKVFFGVSYEIAILRARRDEGSAYHDD